MPLTLSPMPAGYSPAEYVHTRPLKIAYITWNMHNNVPSETDIANILAAHNGEVDVIVIATQEETRSQKRSLGQKIMGGLGAFGGQRLSFDTRTSVFGPGRVSLCVLSNHPFEINQAGKVQEATKWYKMANKGGIHFNMTIGDHTLDVIGMHLDSHSPVARLRETKDIMNGVDQKTPEYLDALDYVGLVKKAKTAVLLGGDLNYRDRYTQEGDVIDPRNSQDALMRHFDMHGFSDISRKIGDYTYSGNTSNQNSPTLKPSASSLKMNDSIAPTDIEATIAAANDLITTSSNQSSDGEAVSDSGNLARQADQKRPHVAQGGKLDRVLYRGAEPKSEVIVQPDREKSRTSDHKPVVAIFEVKKPENDFEHTKQFVCNKLKSMGITSEAYNNNILALQKTDENQKRLVNIYRECEKTIKQMLILEESRIKAEELRAKASQISQSKKPWWKIFTTEKKWLEIRANRSNQYIQDAKKNADRVESGFLAYEIELSRNITYILENPNPRVPRLDFSKLNKELANREEIFAQPDDVNSYRSEGNNDSRSARSDNSRVDAAGTSTKKGLFETKDPRNADRRYEPDAVRLAGAPKYLKR